MLGGCIYFLCPDVKAPAGGVQKIYEFAECLHVGGFDVSVVHLNPNYKPHWFNSTVKVVGRKSAKVLPGDLLVVPEFMTSILPQLEGCAKLILNQAFFSPGAVYFQDKEVVSIVSTSRYIQRHGSFSYPTTPNFLVRLGFDSSLFKMGNTRRKRQIAYMPRRRSDDSKWLIEVLRNIGALDSWDVVPIDRLASHQVALILQESMIFLSLSHREGFGLPPFEAMACGCLVIGFHGHGGAEFFNPDYCFPIVEDDICSFQEVLLKCLLDPDIEQLTMKMGGCAAAAIASQYSMEIQNRDVVEAFGKSMELAGRLTPQRPVALGSLKFESSRMRIAARFFRRTWNSLLE